MDTATADSQGTAGGVQAPALQNGEGLTAGGASRDAGPAGTTDRQVPALQNGEGLTAGGVQAPALQNGEGLTAGGVQAPALQTATEAERRTAGDDWLFVAGMPRSGTTVMARLLTLHPDCTVLLETGLPVCTSQAVRPNVEGRGGYCSAAFRGAYADGDEQRCQWPLPRLRVFHKAEEELVRAIRGMLEGYRAAMFPGARLFGDKWPAYGLYWPIVREIFPASRFVVMDRDLDEAVASAVRCWDQRPQYARRQAVLRRDGMKGCPGAYWVRLEELNESPESVMADVLDVVGLAPDAYPWEMMREQFFTRGARCN